MSERSPFGWRTWKKCVFVPAQKAAFPAWVSRCTELPAPPLSTDPLSELSPSSSCPRCPSVPGPPSSRGSTLVSRLCSRWAGTGQRLASTGTGNDRELLSLPRF